MRHKFILLFILLLACLLRFYQLGSIPGSLNQDEAAIGYNAYSLLKTGADEHGKFLPLALQSFGDWKLPVYEYVDIPFIAIFGLTEVAVRLPSAIAGILGVLLIYKITELFFKDKKISLFAAFFFAISPWSIYFSRAAYEVNLATTFFLGGAYLLFSYLTDMKKLGQLLIPASILFGLTIFTYHSYTLFIPLFLIGMISTFYKKFSIGKLEIASSIIIAFFILLSFVTINSTGPNKISNLSILNNQNVIYNRADKIKSDGANDNPIVKKLIYNKYVAVGYQFGQNYLGAFSPDFLFNKGGEKLQHNLGYFGNFYLFDALLLLAGLVGVCWYREKAIIFLLPWFLLGPVPSALTTDTPNSTRLFLLFPVAIIVMSYGAGKIVDLLKCRRFSLPVLVILLIVFLFNITLFLDGYFVHFNTQRMRYWRYGNKNVAELTKEYPDYSVVVRGPEDFRYIYLLFYEKYDPMQFLKEVKYYPVTDEGFLYVKRFGRYKFVNAIDYNMLQKKTIYIDDKSVQNLSHRINLPSGEPILGYTISEDVKK